MTARAFLCSPHRLSHLIPSLGWMWSASEPAGEEPISETKIEVEIPNINSDLEMNYTFVKLPKFLSIESK